MKYTTERDFKDLIDFYENFCQACMYIFEHAFVQNVDSLHGNFVSKLLFEDANSVNVFKLRKLYVFITNKITSKNSYSHLPKLNTL